MKICILQSVYPKDHTFAEHDPYFDPSNFIDSHTFEHKWIKKETYKEQIDAAVAEGYEFYFNLMWGQFEDEVAGIEACEYFESFDLPASGIRSQVLKRSKNDFYRDCRVIGAPKVPGTSNYPLFVKPATGCGSQFISHNSICKNRGELVQQLERIHEDLAPGRKIAGKIDQPGLNASLVDDVAIPDNVVVQEYISGWDYSVVVIEVGDHAVALDPECYVYPTGYKPYKEFLRFDVKFHPETHIELLRREEYPVLFHRLQKVALQAFRANEMTGRNWGNVDIRVTANGDPTVIEVNPMPTIFLPREHEWEDIAIRECFPGGHVALLNSVIATQLIRRDIEKERLAGMAIKYNDMSPHYNDALIKTDVAAIYQHLLSVVGSISGTYLDLAAGTGKFGEQVVRQSRTMNIDLTAIELSPGMAEICRTTDLYDTIHTGPLQKLLPTAGFFDHIGCASSMYFLSPLDFTLSMVCMFLQARRSIIVTLDEVPEEYNRRILNLGASYACMIGYNHVSLMETTFCNPPPRGWKLAERYRHSAWKSPNTGVKVYMTGYVFLRG